MSHSWLNFRRGPLVSSCFLIVVVRSDRNSGTAMEGRDKVSHLLVTPDALDRPLGFEHAGRRPRGSALHGFCLRPDQDKPCTRSTCPAWCHAFPFACDRATGNTRYPAARSYAAGSDDPAGQMGEAEPLEMVAPVRHRAFAHVASSKRLCLGSTIIFDLSSGKPHSSRFSMTPVAPISPRGLWPFPVGTQLR